MKNIVLSFDFFPKIGGAHLWIYEIYKIWNNEIVLLTKKNAKNSEEKGLEKNFDNKNHGAISVYRNFLPIDNFSIVNPVFHYKIIYNLFVLFGFVNSNATIHCLRAYPEGFLALCVKYFCSKLKIVVYIHGEEIIIAQTSRLLNFIAKKVYKHSDILIANSLNTKNLMEKFNGQHLKINVVHPGVDYKLYEANKKFSTNEKLKYVTDNKTIILLSVSRLEPRKNQKIKLYFSKKSPQK